MSSPVSLPSGSVAARIERELALGILRGERGPGTHLPPVRALALEFGVAPPTVQRVIDRLESAGLVTVKRGSGVRVNDFRRGIDLSLLPLWFEALADAPERAGQLLRDFLELRRVVAVHLVRTSLPRILQAAPELAVLAAAVDVAKDTDALAAADLAFTRAVVDACGQMAVSAVFAIAERLVMQVPHVAEALYADRAYHRRTVRGVIAAFGQGDIEVAATRMDRVLASWDRRAADRFVELSRVKRRKDP
jgi:DNA-binding FadR family transcriptional regulator